MKLPASFLALILISVSIFGLILMNHGVFGHGGCVASISSKNMPCAEKADLANYINLHGDFLKKFIGPIGFTILTVIFVFSFFVVFTPGRLSGQFFEKFIYFGGRFWRLRREEIKFLSGRNILARLAFQKNSPPIF